MTNTIFKPEETRQPVLYLDICIAFSSGLVVKNPSANAEDAGSILGSGRSPGVGNGNPFQYCMGNSVDRGAWQAAVHGVAEKSDMTWDQTKAATTAFFWAVSECLLKLLKMLGLY